MMDVGAAEGIAGRARATCLDRLGIVGVPRVPNIERTVGGEGLSCPARACRQDAVEHIDATQYRLNDIVRFAHAHQVSRSLAWQHVDGKVEAAEHRLLTFADSQSSDRISIEPNIDQSVGGRRAKPLVERPLLDAEDRCPFGMCTATVELLP